MGTAAQGTLASSTSVFSFTVASGSTAVVTDTTNITNTGPGKLTGPVIGAISYGAGWSSGLTATFAAGYQLTLNFDPTALAPGAYTATVPITDTNATNTPLNLSVTVTVAVAARPATLVLSSKRLQVVATEGQDATTQTITVTNGGDDPFVGLAINNINESWILPTIDTDTGVVTVAFETSALAAGTHSDARFDVIATNATNTPQRVGCTLTVVGAPAQLVLSPNALGFNGVHGGPQPATQTVTFTNAGGGTLGALGFQTIQYQQGNGWLSGVFNPSNANELLVTVDTTGLVAGAYNAVWPMTAASAGNSPQNLQVAVVVQPAQQPGLISLTPPSLTFSATAGGANPTPQTVTITDSGGGGLGTLGVGAITYGSGSGWLAISLSNNVVTVTPTTGALAAGTYTATFPVTATTATNTPQTANVTFTVNAAAPAVLALTPPNLAFVALVGGSNPASQTVAITNTGGGSLGTLGVGVITTSSGGAWCACAIVGTTATVTLTTGALTAGNYTATVPITSTLANNSPQNISVAFTVSTQSAGLTFVPPIYTLPTFTAYDPADDKCKITAASTMDRAWNPSASVTTITTNTADLQAEIDARAASNSAWTIKVATNITITGINLPARPSATAGDIYIMSNGDASLPTPSYANNGYLTGGTTHRVRPADAANMWEIRAPAGANAITIATGANVCHYVISGCDIAPSGANAVNTLVNLAPVNTQANPNVRSNAANYPSYITLDRCYIHNNGGYNNNGVHTGVRWEVGYGKIRNCWITGMADDSESKALLTICNPGPTSFQNSYIEAAGINYMLGGADPEIPGHVPGDVFFENCHFPKLPIYNAKHPDWDGGATYTGGVKNNFEYKYGDRLLVERCVFEENWYGGQVGIAIVPKVANQGGGTNGAHVYLRNMTFRHFAIYNAFGGFGLTGLTTSFTDPQFSRPQRLDIHSGIIQTGTFAIYGPAGSTNRQWHSQVICQSFNKDFRLKRLSGVSSDEPYSAWYFTAPQPTTPSALDVNDNGLWEDCTFQWGTFSGSTRKAYAPSGAVPAPFDGDAAINWHCDTTVWQRIGMFGSGSLPGTVHNPSQPSGSAMLPEHIAVLGSTAYTAIYQDFDPADPAGSDYTIIHSSLTTSGANGTVCGADWAHLSVLLTGVRN